MRHVLYTDARGRKRRSLVRDTDGDETAKQGIPAGPPDLDSLDWEAIKTEINNRFVEQGIFTWEDIQKHPVGLQVVCSVLKRYVAAEFKQAISPD